MGHNLVLSIHGYDGKSLTGLWLVCELVLQKCTVKTIFTSVDFYVRA